MQATLQCSLADTACFSSCRLRTLSCRNDLSSACRFACDCFVNKNIVNDGKWFQPSMQRERRFESHSKSCFHVRIIMHRETGYILSKLQTVTLFRPIRSLQCSYLIGRNSVTVCSLLSASLASCIAVRAYILFYLKTVFIFKITSR